MPLILLPGLLGFLASPDPVLRDDVAYMIFVNWITRDKHFSSTELRDLITILTGNLNQDISTNPPNVALLRSFSVLVLSIIAYYDCQSPFLTEDEISSLLDKTLTYLNAETDLRAYVDNIGWVHATAHSADVLKFLCRNPKTNTMQHEQVLNTIFERLTMPVDTIFTHNEDERLCLTVLDIVRRTSISIDTWQTWLTGFRNWKASKPGSAGFNKIIFAPFMNCKKLSEKSLLCTEIPRLIPER